MKDIKQTTNHLEIELPYLLQDLREADPVFNPTKTKLIIIQIEQIARVHDADNNSIQVTRNEKLVEHIFCFKILNMIIDVDHSGWTEDFNKTVKECFTMLNFIKKFHRLFPSHGKQIA